MKTLIAQDFGGGETGFAERLGRALSTRWRALRDARDRKAAIRELRRLDERMLADVGLSNANLEYVVDEMIARRRGAAHPTGARRATASESATAATVAGETCPA